MQVLSEAKGNKDSPSFESQKTLIAVKAPPGSKLSFPMAQVSPCEHKYMSPMSKIEAEYEPVRHKLSLEVP